MITVEVGEDGRGVVNVAGLTTSVQGRDAAAARAAALTVLVGTAQRLGRPVGASTVTPEGEFAIVVHQDGTVVDAAPATARRRRRPRASRPVPAVTEVPEAPTSWEGEVEVPPTGRASTSPRPPLSPDAPSEVLEPTSEVTPAPRVSRSRTGLWALVALAVVLAAAGTRLGSDYVSSSAHAAHVAAPTPDVAHQALTAREAAAPTTATPLVDASTQLERSTQVLAASAGQVSDDIVRDQLREAIAAASVVDASGPATIRRLFVGQLIDATGRVQAAQVAWRAAQAAAAEQAAAAQAAAQQAAAQQAAAQQAVIAAARQAAATPAEAPAPPPAKAPAAAPAKGATSNVPVQNAPVGSLQTIRASVSSSTGSAAFTVTVTSSGPVPASVAVSVAGRQVVMSGPGSVDGSATFTGSAAGLPAGTQPWTASAGGLSTSGQIEVF